MPVFSTPPSSSCWAHGAFVEGAAARRWADAAPVTIVKKLAATQTVQGYTDNLYRVRIQGKEQTLWGGELANASQPLPGTKQTLLVRIVGTGAGKLRQGEARLFPGGDILRFAPIEVQESDRFSYSLNVTCSDGRGLQGVERLFHLRFTYEACDFPNGEVLLLQRGSKLLFGVRALSSGNETGSLVYKLVFPRDKEGKPNQVRQIETVTECSDTGKTLRVKSSVSAYRWDGARMVK